KGDQREDSTEMVVGEIQKKIKDAFEVFQHETNNTVDVREIGTIIRSLGCCPSEGELHDLIAEVEEDEPTGYIHLEKFISMVTKVLMEKRYRPIPEDVLLHAFEVLDPSKRGHLTKEEQKWRRCCLAAVDPESNIINYRDYLTMMVVEDNESVTK
uniref:EF-hand calcium binding domain 2 n=1 Tax=Ornithorhynchus anatinus TaxID=9258 RepID=A0A6I8N6B6_ORNAN